MADDLTPLLDTLRIRTTLFGIADLPAGWGVDFPPGAGAYFHVLYGGDGWLHLDDQPPAPVRSGDVILLAHATAHRITHGTDGAARVRFDPARWEPNVVNAATPRDPTPTGMTLICAAVQTERRARPPLLDSMPAVFQVPSADPSAEQLGLAVTMLRAEAAAALPGRQAVLARLGDVLLLNLVRRWLERSDAATAGWTAALRDGQIGPVLLAVHADLAAPWSLESMAAIAQLSRSRFAERFRDLLGVSPKVYLTRWRLDAAQRLLADGQSVRGAGRAVGYTSEQAFSRAFVRHHGETPSQALAAARPR